MTPPIATPMDCPKPRNEVDVATAIARFSAVADACTASATEGRTIPMPMPGTRFKKIQVKVPLFASNRHSKPIPMVEIHHPIQTAQ